MVLTRDIGQQFDDATSLNIEEKMETEAVTIWFFFSSG